VTVVPVGRVDFSSEGPLVLIAGPCQLEDAASAVAIARHLAAAASAAGMGYVFKASFDKANRTSHEAPRGPGLAAGLGMLAAVHAAVGCPVVTDVHETTQCAPVAEVADILQIPALLSRQTDLLQAAGRTGRAVMIKKGQFMAPPDIAHAAAKVAATGNRRILLCERGTSFGYRTLVSDLRGLPVMARTGWPVIFDATHSVQRPSAEGAASGGEREFVAPLARAAVAVGVAGVFLETHPDPDRAPSDGATMLPLDEVAPLLATLAAIDRARRQPQRLREM
jgi:2-dehydro-3-deoxyphosphooctonate aldolase (KDO 8-P synthase)